MGRMNRDGLVHKSVAVVSLFLVLLAIGWVLAIVLRPSAPKLRAEDRDAVLAKMRSWLAEGSGAT